MHAPNPFCGKQVDLDLCSQAQVLPTGAKT
jgi:hypothetical protein